MVKNANRMMSPGFDQDATLKLQLSYFRLAQDQLTAKHIAS